MVPHIIFANILYWFIFPPYGENLREKNDYSIITSDFTTVILSGCNGKSDSVVFHLLLGQPVCPQHHWAVFTQHILFHFGINF